MKITNNACLVNNLLFLRMRDLALLVLSLLLINCTYEPEDVFFKEISEEPKDQPTSDFFNSSDTIYARGLSSLIFNFEDGNEYYAYEIYMGDDLIREGDDRPSGFYFNSYDYESGFHLMTLRLFSKSNTGSLADKLDAEAAVIDFQRVLNIDHEPIEIDIQSSSFYIEDSVLIFDWPNYNDYEFSDYYIMATSKIN
ncbi:MAG: hypothetical protein GY816_10390 [Cytophagales bacterium]|nr:hypothetical protein [Cytophagales bacterium]